MKKKLFLLLMVVPFFIPSCSDDIIDNLNTKNEKVENSSMIDVKLVDQSKALDAFDRLISSFQSGRTKSNSNVNYPEYYGGCYINENQELVVYVTGDTIQGRSTIFTTTGTDDCITKSCTYSYNELLEINFRITDYIISNANPTLMDNIAVVSIMDKENCIEVKLLNCSESNINEFRSQIIDSPAITFVQTEEKVQKYVDPYPGYGLSGFYGSFTFGYRVNSWYGSDGFITAGHAVKSTNQMITDNGVQIARCDKVQYGGNIDAAYCESTGYVNFSNRIGNGSVTLTSTVQSAVVGQYIYKYGAVSGETQGLITSTSAQFTVKDDNVHLTDHIATSIYAGHGDSGGPAYARSGSSANIIGIVEGGSSGVTYVTKASNINSAFSVSGY